MKITKGKLQTFHRTTSAKFFTPRRQVRKEKYSPIFSELGVLCAFARVIIFRFRNPTLNQKFQICLVGTLHGFKNGSFF